MKLAIRFEQFAAFVLAALFVLAPAAKADANNNQALGADLKISGEPLTADTELKAFRVTDVFKVILAGFEEQINQVNADPTLTADQKKALVKSLREKAFEVLYLHEKVVDIAPLAFAVSIDLGIELPIRVTRRILKIGEAGVQFAGGVTFAVAKHRGTGDLEWRIGLSTLSGGLVSFGANPNTFGESFGSHGEKGFLGVSVIVPLRESLPAMRLGDLQGWYLGAGGELDWSPAGKPLALHGGLYAQPGGITTLDAAMLFGYFGVGSSGRLFSAKPSALYFGTIDKKDGSFLNNFVPFFGSSQFSDKQREADLRKQVPTTEEIREAAQKAAEQLDR